MLEERCFMCGGKAGRGMQPNVGAHERMEKLVSVSRTVSHSSTIICDILSRILNETVMKDEIICKICFNLLDDIDYHLKEAQEKTDEVTNKFLDKRKDSYQSKPQPLATVHIDEDLNEIKHTERFHHHKSAKKRQQNSAKKKHEEADFNLTEDEMSVNTINKNKAKLLSHVLNPNKKSKFKTPREEPPPVVPPPVQAPSPPKVVETRETPKSHKVIPAATEIPEKKVNTRSGGKRKELSKKYLSSSSEDSESDSEQENESEEDENTVTPSNAKKKKPNNELVTVNMDDLGDLLSKPNMYYAKKSSPKAAILTSTTPQPAEENIGPTTCKLCHKTFKKSINLQLHMEKVHEINSKPLVIEEDIPETHKCGQCSREFVTKQALQKHVSDHANEKRKEQQTEKKPTVPVQRNTQPAKENEVKATCQHCNQTFRRQYNLKTHINRVHLKEKKFKCNRCDKSFATNSDLKQHLGTHGEGKMFKCDECDRQFSNRDSIILHKKQHNQEKTHFCSICLKGFYKASCLSRHMRSHTGERPYSCDFCNKAFSQSTTLKVHKEKCSSSRGVPPATNDQPTVISSA